MKNVWIIILLSLFAFSCEEAPSSEPVEEVELNNE